jgi:hypothetical protein
VSRPTVLGAAVLAGLPLGLAGLLVTDGAYAGAAVNVALAALLVASGYRLDGWLRQRRADA